MKKPDLNYEKWPILDFTETRKVFIVKAGRFFGGNNIYSITLLENDKEILYRLDKEELYGWVDYVLMFAAMGENLLRSWAEIGIINNRAYIEFI